MSAYLKDKTSIKDILAKMTVREKALLITGGSTFSSYGIDKYGIPKIHYYDCASGINLSQFYMDADCRNMVASQPDSEGEPREGLSILLAIVDGMAAVWEVAENIGSPEKLSPRAKAIYDDVESKRPGGKYPSCFPAGIALGASWDPEMVHRVGEAVGKEAAAFKLDIMLGSPNVNIHRDPRNGRLFEGFSEDPHLVSKLAPEIVKGVQEQGVGANVKHFVANNQETQRQGINEHIPERALYEIYFPGFKACVQDGGVKTVMSAYNQVNGKPCAMNKWLLTDVLRKQWGFKGFVMSDWGAAYYQSEAIDAGNDVDMPGPRNVTPIVEAVESGKLSVEALDLACTRFLSTLVELLDMHKNRAGDFDRRFSEDAAYQMAADSMVLLKNNDGVLPLAKDAKVSFLGEKSRKFLISGGGSAIVVTDQFADMAAAAAEIIGGDNVTYGEIAPDADTVVITAGMGSEEGRDHTDMELPADEKRMLLDAISQAKAAGKKIVLVMNTGMPVETADFLDDIDALLWVFFPGQEGGRAAADILFGDVNPSGKLPLTYPKRLQDCPTYGNFPGACDEVWYGEGIYVGYRYYDTKAIRPLYPFGYGLSYTRFRLSNLKLSREKLMLDDDESITVSVDVTNTGMIAGKEVVQIYVADEVSTLPKPQKELKAFRKVSLAPGETKTLSFTLAKTDFAGYDSRYHEWVTEPGWYRVLAGRSSRDIDCEARFRAYGHSRYDFGPDTQMMRMLNRQDALDVICRHLEGIMPENELVASLGFTPYMQFSDVWKGVIKGRVKKAGKDEAALFAEICAELAGLDVGEPDVPAGDDR